MKAGDRRADRFAGREPRRFERRVVVSEGHLDDLGHVNNVVYVQWIQDIAGEHWRTAAHPALVDAVAWVLSRHEIDYRRPARAGDALTIRTWVGAATPVRFERHVEILDEADRVVVRSRTEWAPIDRGTGRLMRLDLSAHDPFYE